MTTYIIGTNPKIKVNLTDKDFVGKGGEKTVYQKGGTAYCVYHSPDQAMPKEKVSLLAAIGDPAVITPKSLLFDSKQRRVGETMDFIADAYVLCQLFTNKFRSRHGIDNSTIVSISKEMIRIMEVCHKAGAIMVDPNDNNWLVSKDFRSVYAIDTSCFQVAGFPPTAIKAAVRDPHSSLFDERSDFYSLAVVLGWLWVGIHPFGMYHPKYEMTPDGMQQKMRDGVSFFDSDAELNRACRPIQEIPGPLMQWMKDVYTSPKVRYAPPSDFTSTKLFVDTTQLVGGENLDITHLKAYSRTILDLFVSVPSFERGEVIVKSPISGSRVGISIQDGLVRFDGPVVNPPEIYASKVFYSGGAAYAVSGDNVIGFHLSDRDAGVQISMRTASHIVANHHALKVFRGGVIQKLLNRCLLTVFPSELSSYVVSLPEMSGKKLLDAMVVENVLVAVWESGGEHFRSVFRFSDDFSTYDCDEVKVDSYHDANFTVCRGRLVMVDENGLLHVSHAAMGKPGKKIIDDPGIDGDCYLSTDGSRVLMSKGNSVYRVQFKG